MNIEVLENADSVAERAAGIIAENARAAVAARGRFVIAVSGGHTPWLMLRKLAMDELPWRAVHVAPVDERVAPAGHPDRNLTHTASLVPGDPVLDIENADVALTGPYQGRRRMTLTYPILDRSRRVLSVVTGA